MGNTKSVPRPKMAEVDAQMAQDQADYGRLYQCLKPHPHVMMGSRPLKLMLGEGWESNDVDVALAATSSEEFGQRVKTLHQCLSQAYGASDSAANPHGVRPPIVREQVCVETAVSVLGRNTGLATLGLPVPSSQSATTQVQFIGIAAQGTDQLRDIVHRNAHPPANVTMTVDADGRKSFGVPFNALSAIFDRRVRHQDCRDIEVRTGRKAKYATRGFELDERIKETSPPLPPADAWYN